MYFEICSREDRRVCAKIISTLRDFRNIKHVLKVCIVFCCKKEVLAQGRRELFRSPRGKNGEEKKDPCIWILPS